MSRFDTFIFNGEEKTIEIDEIGEQAISYVKEGKSFFLTGKAGTGKTTLIHYIQKKIIPSYKHIAILAPTGIAAKNAGGVTIHSFLRLPLSIYLPNHYKKDLYSLDKAGIEAVKSIDILFVDEISMVRCDVFDMMDKVLRHYRKVSEPFGGIQVILVGDLYQLMLVAESNEWKQLSNYYKSVFFFSSEAYKTMECPMLELNKVHRQEGDSPSAAYFVDMLNDIRIGKISSQQIRTLQNKYSKYAGNYKGWIILTTHKTKAWAINNKRLKRLYDKEEKIYKAVITDYFPINDYPTEEVLRLKIGAKVMFIRNDNIFNKYKNGTMGKVVYMTDSSVTVQIDETKENVTLYSCEWENQDYTINKQTKEIETRVCGTFTQIPLKLAWAITIHKSQGLTFDKVVIDVGSAFTAGQVYVALSRCKALKNIRLLSEITKDNIKVDQNVVDFYSKNNDDEINIFDSLFDDIELDLFSS